MCYIRASGITRVIEHGLPVYAHLCASITLHSSPCGGVNACACGLWSKNSWLLPHSIRVQPLESPREKVRQDRRKYVNDMYASALRLFEAPSPRSRLTCSDADTGLLNLCNNAHIHGRNVIPMAFGEGALCVSSVITLAFGV